MFVATHYQVKPAVFDTVAHLYYTGFKTMAAARKKVEELEAGK